MTENIAEILDKFKKEIMPKVRETIKQHVAAYPGDFKRSARQEYLKRRMEEVIFNTFYLMDDYERLSDNDDTDSRIFVGSEILDAVDKILKLQSEIISLRKPEKPGDITEDMIVRAREYPFTNLYEFKRNQGLCPFHGDKDPSMHLFPDNHVYCFSCAKGWDTIGFVQQRDGLSFPEAVKRLS